MYKESVGVKATVFPLMEAQGVQGNITGLYVSCLGSVSIFLSFCNFPLTVKNKHQVILEKKCGAFLFRLIS